MKKISTIILIILLLAAGMSGCSSKSQAYTAEQLTQKLKEAGLPVDNVIVYTSDSDPNKLLGRPNQYISKVNFADTSVKQFDQSSPVGGSIEVFNNSSDLKKRKEYVEEVTKTASILAQYIYANGNYLLRIDHNVTPENAAKYEKVFKEIQ